MDAVCEVKYLLCPGMHVQHSKNSKINQNIGVYTRTSGTDIA